MEVSDAFVSQSACPGQERLTAFNEGRLPEEALETVAEHLTRCASCNGTLAELRDVGDLFLGWLRDAAREPGFPEDPEYLRMQAAACKLTLPSTSGVPPNLGTRGEPPRSLGQYHLLEMIGRGGMGVVYKALHMRLKKEVAVKILPAKWAGEPAAVARFLRETEAAGSVRHPNVVEATDAGEAEGFLFLVMEFLDGCDLARVVHTHGPLRIPDACEAVRQAALGLQRAHERGLVHRDIKPSNLMLTVDGVVKILDLGLARLDRPVFSEGDSLTDSGQVMGTADYMAPEQASDSHSVDIRADLYSLGCTLYKLLTGQPPFPSPGYDSYAKKLRAHALTPVPPITARRADVPTELSTIIDRLLAKEPEERFATPGEVARTLATFAQGAALTELLAGVRAADARVPGPHPGSAETPRHRNTARSTSAELRTPPARARVWSRPGRRAVIVATALVCIGVAAALALRLAWAPECDPEPLVPESDPEPLVWHPLLKRPPVPLYWKNPRGISRLEHSPEKQELRLHSDYVSLIRLGTARRMGYKVQIGISQPGQWNGGVGFFLGGRTTLFQGKPVLQCQYFQLGLVTLRLGNKAPFYVLKRMALRLPLGKGEAINGPGSAQIIPAPAQDEHILELVVGNHELVKVRWAGQECPDLVRLEANKLFTEADYVGDFGVYSYRGYGVYRNAQWMPFEREKP